MESTRPNPTNPKQPPSATIPCAVALGSNLGESQRILAAALQQLGSLTETTVTARSSLYKTAPVGPPQPDYLNACALIETHLSAQDLMAALLAIEADFGRIRQERWGPRILDLDLILYADQVINEPDLQLPHPRFRERAFVLVPLAEIAPHWVDPVTGRTILDLCSALDRNGVEPLSSAESA
ncbi:2-amino-4-hydroxy-6-hydroxymethyldihydropteridine diphosphokinase [Leptolyngbya sp. BL0902]|uniref:2-amino-4-hydroxy-6- hydroxymethyldihydropteridine diphosphokinase n=1 Tax=Leptolyngbya sp. BL0902 TaxID=1115757 RepID=UPI001935D5D9|nr:2-amino-4-hydroxy-6-hydroxymethyldihydropteridine diphosphokinase [Leptolyngbya sp. BL0902]QQE67091.1 2-amino-4-hydroxy-6-hydroxymethyldihydropteridine diphosphokinase [Leptolyngbya sp. BL0902]